jgi:hypothetical protein
MKEKSPDTFERQLRNYQRLTLTLFYPPLLSIFACISGYFISNYEYYLTYASTRFLMVALVESNRGAFSFPYFVPALYSLALVGLYAFLTLQSAKGKLYPLIVGSVLYLADAIYASLLYGTSFYGQMSLGVYVAQVLLHLAFLVLYGFAIAKYAKLSRPHRKGNDL